MRNARTGILLIFLLLISIKSFSQNPSFLWKLETLPQLAEKHQKHFKRISTSGFQLDQEAYEKGELILKISKLSAIGKTLQRRKNMITFSAGSGFSVSLTRDEMETQLFRQFQEKENSNRRNFKNAIKGKGKSTASKEEPFQLHFGKTERNIFPGTFIFYTKEQPYASLTFDTVFSSSTEYLPYVEYSKCIPFDRASYFQDYLKEFIPAPKFIPSGLLME